MTHDTHDNHAGMVEICTHHAHLILMNDATAYERLTRLAKDAVARAIRAYEDGVSDWTGADVVCADDIYMHALADLEGMLENDFGPDAMDGDAFDALPDLARELLTSAMSHIDWREVAQSALSGLKLTPTTDDEGNTVYTASGL